MQTARIILFFELSGNGWSETYYTPATTLDAAQQTGNLLILARLGLLSNPTIITAMRVSDVDQIRASRLYAQQETSNFNYISNADAPENSAMMRIFAADNRNRALYLRGNPDQVFDRLDPNNADAQTWLQQYALFGQFLCGQQQGQAAFLVKDRPRPIFSGTGKNVQDIVVAAPQATKTTRLQLTTLGAHSFISGDAVSFYKMGLPRLTGNFTVVEAIDSTNFTVSYHLPSGLVYGGKGSCLKVTPTYVAMSTFADQPRFTGKKTGRPFDISRGRRVAIPR